MLAPEFCALCGVPRRRAAAWCPRGPAVAGVRTWDAPHLCGVCARSLSAGPRRIGLDAAAAALPVWAATATGPAVSAAVGAWKYRGLRGLAWPLGSLFTETLDLLPPALRRDAALVPVPLHRSRRRRRGFNQAAVLARFAQRAGGLAVREDLARRARDTAQQAKLQGHDVRAANLSGAFRCVPAPPAGGPPLLLVDDLVTSGATVLSLASSLVEGGWRVGGVIALAVADRGHRGSVDSDMSPA